MKGKRKDFNQAWHDSADFMARTFGKNLFEKSYGCRAEDNPDKYGVDLIVYDGKEIVCFAEVEIKRYLDNFCFDSLHILERKKKFFVSPSGKPVLFCLFSTDGGVCAMTRGSYMMEMEPVPVDNNAVKSGEYFYKVPLTHVRMLKRNNEGGYK